MSGLLGEDYTFTPTETSVRQSWDNKAALRLSSKLDDYDASDSQVKNTVSDHARRRVLNDEEPTPVLHVSNGSIRRRVRSREIFNDHDAMQEWEDDNRQFEVQEETDTLGAFVDEYIGSAELYLTEDGKEPRPLINNGSVNWDTNLSYDWDELDAQVARGRVNPDEPVDGTYLEASDELFAELVTAADPRGFDSYDEMADTVEVHYNRVYTRPGGEYTDENGNVYGETVDDSVDETVLDAEEVPVEA